MRDKDEIIIEVETRLGSWEIYLEKLFYVEPLSNADKWPNILKIRSKAYTITHKGYKSYGTRLPYAEILKLIANENGEGLLLYCNFQWHTYLAKFYKFIWSPTSSFY